MGASSTGPETPWNHLCLVGLGQNEMMLGATELGSIMTLDLLLTENCLNYSTDVLLLLLSLKHTIALRSTYLPPIPPGVGLEQQHTQITWNSTIPTV